MVNTPCCGVVSVTGRVGPLDPHRARGRQKGGTCTGAGQSAADPDPGADRETGRFPCTPRAPTTPRFRLRLAARGAVGAPCGRVGDQDDHTDPHPEPEPFHDSSCDRRSVGQVTSWERVEHLAADHADHAVRAAARPADLEPGHVAAGARVPPVPTHRTSPPKRATDEPRPLAGWPALVRATWPPSKHPAERLRVKGAEGGRSRTLDAETAGCRRPGRGRRRAARRGLEP